MRRDSSEAGTTRSVAYIRAPLAEGGCTSLREPYVANAAISLRSGSLRLPWQADSLPVPIVGLGRLGRRGLVHRDISGKEKERPGVSRGPFDVLLEHEPDAEYPVLWGHVADRERHVVVQPDGYAAVRESSGQRALTVWEAATRLHFSLDFQLNSQSLAACLTPKKSIGGRVWPNFQR